MDAPWMRGGCKMVDAPWMQGGREGGTSANADERFSVSRGLLRRFRPVHARPGACKEVVGATGFEPATSASRTQRSTKLSHAPTGGSRVRSREERGR